MGSTGSGANGKNKSGPKERGEFQGFVNWFEIPAADLNRAVAFYSHIYGIEMETTRTGGYAMGFFPAGKGVGGAIVQGNGCVPGGSGTLLYLNGGRDLQTVLNRVAEAGGHVVMGKTEINPEFGFYAVFIDSEGNKLALHSEG